MSASASRNGGMDGSEEVGCQSVRPGASTATETTRLLSETTSDVPNLVDRTTRKDEFGLTKKSVWFVFFASMLVLGGFVWILSRIGRDTPAVGLDPRLGIYQASSAAVDGGWSDAVTFDIRFDAASNSYRAYADAPRASSRSSPQKWFASGRYTQNFRDNGWNYLEIENAPVSSDEDYIKGMKAVGVMEGFLTCNHTKMFYLNYMHGMFEGRLPMDSTINFLRKNYNWVRAKADTLYASDDYWLSVKGTLAQLEGMVEGHRLSCPCEEAEAVDVDSSAGATSGRGMGSKCDGSFWTMNNPTIMHFLLLNANGDLFQINQKFTQSSDDGRRKQMQSEKDLEGADQISDQEPMASLDASNSSITASHRQLRLPRKRTNHCSAIFKLLADKSDVVFGHNTWDTYESASPRAIKRFKLHTFERSDVILRRWDPASPIYGDFEAFWDPYPTATTRATETTRWGKASSAAADRDGNSSPKARLQEILFSSSAGFLSSVDDFYVTKGGHGDLAIIETSLDVYRDPIISQIVPESMLYWMRVRTATVLASSGSEWALWFSLFHSGTYVNQWLVLDMALFHPGEPDLRKGLFTVLEEMPGKAHIEDKSAHLSTYGYWASYNLPYFPEILRYSGASDLCDANPSLNCYSTDPRARIFRARQGNVTSISALQDLMLYNDFERDPLSLNDPCNAIACRQDLESNVWIRSPFGAIDAKVGSITQSLGEKRFSPPPASSSPAGKEDSVDGDTMMRPRVLRSRESAAPRAGTASVPSDPPIKIWAKLGPSNAQQETFCWSSFWGGMGIWRETEKDYSHEGHPDCFDFDWQTFPDASLKN